MRNQSEFGYGDRQHDYDDRADEWLVNDEDLEGVSYDNDMRPDYSENPAGISPEDDDEVMEESDDRDLERV